MKVKVTQSCLTLCDPMDCPWNSPGQNTGVGSCSLLQGIFPTQGLNPGLPHCRQILYQLRHQGSRRILGSSTGKESACNAGDPGSISGSIPGWGRSTEKGINIQEFVQFQRKRKHEEQYSSGYWSSLWQSYQGVSYWFFLCSFQTKCGIEESSETGNLLRPIWSYVPKEGRTQPSFSGVLQEHSQIPCFSGKHRPLSSQLCRISFLSQNAFPFLFPLE